MIVQEVREPPRACARGGDWESMNKGTSALAALCENAFPCGVCPTPASIRGKQGRFRNAVFERKHARLQPKMWFASHARHYFPSAVLSSFLRAPRGFRIRPRRRLFRVRIFQCRLRSTQACVCCRRSCFHTSKYCFEKCFGMNACPRTVTILNKIVELVSEDARGFFESTKKRLGC